MKYDWMIGDEPEMKRPSVREYFGYRDTICASLPPDLQRFVRKCSLHDATLKRFDLAVADRQMIIELVGNHYGEELAPEENIPFSYARRFRLTYGGVQSLTSPGNPTGKTPGPHGTGVGDLIYDEIELLAPGEFEHRILFATGFEFHVRFTEFSLWYEDFEFQPTAS